MRDVVRIAGVSRMTVSRALKKDSPVSKTTRERILQVVRDMNYVPDQMEVSLTTKRSGFVAVLVPLLSNLHFAETVAPGSDNNCRWIVGDEWPRRMWLALIMWWITIVCLFFILQKRGMAVDTYQAIWGPDPRHPGNQRPAPQWGRKGLGS